MASRRRRRKTEREGKRSIAFQECKTCYSLTLWQNIWTSERGINDNTGEKYKNRSFVMCTLHVICADEEIKEDKIGGAYRTHGGK